MIYYIAGAGRSGSTLLDIVLGNPKQHFSIGELNNIPNNNEELCSCGKKVWNCEFWSRVFELWEHKRKMSFDEYKNAQWDFLRNKRTHKIIWNHWFPSKKYEELVHDTRELYNAIYIVSNRKVLIDSSKIPQYLLLILKTGLPIRIIHLKRNINGVLESKKKKIPKNIKKGIERTIKSQNSFYILLNWYINLFLLKFLTVNKKKINVQYEKFVKNPNKIVEDVFSIDKVDLKVLKNRGPFKAEHMIAGGRVRMSDNIYINSRI